jgi:hypothetical protein
MDRDHAAARRIVSRGLLAQAHTTTDRATSARTIRTTVDGTVALVRRPKKTTRHGVPAPHRPEDLLPVGRRRLSHRTCRQRTRAAERTGFHHLHATEVHPLTPRFGSPDGNRTRPRRGARKAWKPQAHTEF